MNASTLDWLPVGSSVSLLPVGKWWDAVKVPGPMALEALVRLRGESGAVIEDPWADIYYWLVPVGKASTWAMPTAAKIAVLSDCAHLVVPGARCTAGPRWHIPPSGSSLLADPTKLHNALARAIAVVTKLPSDQAYRALVGHYDECAGCSHGGRRCGEWCTHSTAPCAVGASATPGLDGGAVVLICCHCQVGIRPDEPYETHVHDRASGPPYVTYSHRGVCPDELHSCLPESAGAI